MTVENVNTIKRRTFNRRLRQRKAQGHCCCWDCLRSVGLTPPLGARHQHPQLNPSREVGWVAAFELRGEDRDKERRPNGRVKGMGVLAEHKAADHELRAGDRLMKTVRMV